ncbi:DUF2723 domain-containing protein [Candidatus Kaiserbacteria bacterium]|nr:DUF2723 domain-containing protein [Candidatus Kaiserbacteria bacterium]
MTTAVHTLGLAHSTGFPLYVLSAKLFTFVFPFGEFAFRLNIYSALLTALSVALLYVLILEMELSTVAAFLASSTFGLGFSIWRNAGQARIYPLALLFVILLAFIFVRWQKDKHIRYLYWYVLVWGISFGTHLLVLTMIWPLLIMLWQKRDYLRTHVTVLGKAALLFFLPFVQYIYIPIANARHMTTSWGDTGGLMGFLYYITQRQYVYKMIARDWTGIALFFKQMGGVIFSELGAILFMIGIGGLIYFYKENKPLCSALVLASLSNIVIMFSYGNEGDIGFLYRYLFIVHLTVAIGIAYSVTALGRVRNAKWFLVAFLILLIFIELRTNYARNNLRANFIVSDIAQNILETVGPNSILFTTLDAPHGAITYLQSERYRTDVIAVISDQLGFDWYVKDLIWKYPDTFSTGLLTIQGDYLRKNSLRIEEIVQNNLDKRDMYAMFANNKLPDNRTLADDFTITPIGVVNKITAKGDDSKMILAKNIDIWNNYQLRGVFSDTYDKTMEYPLRILYRDALYNLGVSYFKNGFTSQAVDALQYSLKINYTPYAQNELDFIEKQR